MDPLPAGAIAVIFESERTAMDEAGYRETANEMDALSRLQPGFLGMKSARDASGFGITVSYWRDEAAAIDWRDQLDHAATRERGRARWYRRYRVVVTEVRRSYAWHADPVTGRTGAWPGR